MNAPRKQPVAFRLGGTTKELIASHKDWDWACLGISEADKLEALDQAGLLFDFSHEAYWESRNPNWTEPHGVFSADGRMIAILYDPIITGYYPQNTIPVFIVNAKSQNSSRILA